MKFIEYMTTIIYTNSEIEDLFTYYFKKLKRISTNINYKSKSSILYVKK